MRAKTTKKQPQPALNQVAGTYVYDKDLDRVVKVSNRVPKVASKGKASAAAAVGPCGRVCDSGRCPE